MRNLGKDLVMPLQELVFNSEVRIAEDLGPSNIRAATLQKCGVEFFSVFLCQIWRELSREIFRVVRFPGFGCLKRIISPKFHAKKRCENGTFYASFTLLGRGADEYQPTYSPQSCHVLL